MLRDLLEIFGFIFGIIAVPLALILVPVYYGSCRSADIYNARNGTNYTCGDFFWASEQINSSTHTINVK